MLPNLAGIRLAPASSRGRRRETPTGAALPPGNFLRSYGQLVADAEVRSLVADLLSTVIVTTNTVRAWEGQLTDNDCVPQAGDGVRRCLPGNLEKAPDSVLMAAGVWVANVEEEGSCFADRPIEKLRAFLKEKISIWLGPATAGVGTFARDLQTGRVAFSGVPNADLDAFVRRLTYQVRGWLSTGTQPEELAWTTHHQSESIIQILENTMLYILNYAVGANPAETAHNLGQFLSTVHARLRVIPGTGSVPGITKLGCETQYAVRSNPEYVSGLALLGYKYGWDELINTHDQGLNVADSLRSLRVHTPIPNLNNAEREKFQTKLNRMTPLVLAFLDMPKLKGLLRQYIGSPSQVGFNHRLVNWLNSGSNQTMVDTMLSRMPHDGLAVWPDLNADCFTHIKLNEQGQWTPADLALNQTIGDQATNRWDLVNRQPNTPLLPARDDVVVWPYFQGARTLLNMTLAEPAVANDPIPAPTNLALQFLKSAIIRMKHAIEPLYKSIGTDQEEVTLWRGIPRGRYPQLDALAAARQYAQLAQALIPILRQTMVATSKNRTTATEFAAGQGGILVRFTGTCRGFDTNEVLKGRWGCFLKEDEVVMAPGQSYAYDHTANSDTTTISGVQYHQINLRVAYNPRHIYTSYPYWVHGDDPHWELRTLAPPHSPGLV